MRLADTVREFKAEFLNPVATFGVGTNTPRKSFPKSMAIGITKSGKDFVPAVRCYLGGPRTTALQKVFVDLLLGKSKGECEVEWVEMPQAMPPIVNAFGEQKQETQRKIRPIAVGYSLGNWRITAGTLGIFATRKGEKGTFICSNNHILAASDTGVIGDKILQNAPYDGGKKETETVAKLTHVVKLKKQHNLVDCSLAKVDDGIECDFTSLPEGNKFKGDGPNELPEIHSLCHKVGRTTFWTHGSINAVEVDGLAVNFGDKGVLRFDNQIEIVGDKGEFSAGGDSSSCILNEDYKAIGLLFAGGSGRTYANDFREVKKALKITTLC